MSYTAAAVTAVVAAVLLDTVVLRSRLLLRSSYWIAYGILLFFQLLVNGVLTGAGIVVYAPRAILGWRLANAPVEDLGFGFALILVTLSWWVWLGRRSAARG